MLDALGATRAAATVPGECQLHGLGFVRGSNCRRPRRRPCLCSARSRGPTARKLASPRGRRYNSRMRLPRRRTLWLSAALLLVVVVGAWLLVPRTRLTQENFERIHDRMSKTEVRAILGENDQAFPGEMWEARMWQDGGPNWIVVNFDKETGKSCGASPSHSALGIP
jgi:hypothetical protein